MKKKVEKWNEKRKKRKCKMQYIQRRFVELTDSYIFLSFMRSNDQYSEKEEGK